MYKFSHFLPYSSGNVLLSHANEISKIWNERFGHLNYKYIQYLRKGNMVEGTPSIKLSKGTCKGCIVGKHAECKYDKGKEIRVVQVLGFIHSYLIGPLPRPSYENSRYAINIHG